MTNINFTAWTKATGDLAWGAQKAIHDSLTLAAEGKIHLVYGADYVDGQPCLINSVGQMLTTGGGKGVPSKNFGALVGQFDSINRALETQGVNTDNHVSPLAAEILLQNFAPMKPEPELKPLDAPAPQDTSMDVIIPERSDEDLANEWLSAIATDNEPAPVDPFDPNNGPGDIDMTFLDDPDLFEGVFVKKSEQ